VKTLVTGGAGFIGSTIASACLDSGVTPVILDDLSTGRAEFAAGRTFYQGDIADGVLFDRIFADHPDISSVVHCAAHMVVPESVSEPLAYYRNNVAKTIDMVEHLLRNRCRRLLFSSSASVYEPGPDLTVDESSALNPQSPYAATKMMVERILADSTAAYPLRALSLRYFNPVGADPKLRTGLQNPAPTHAMGQLIKAHQTGQPFTVTGVNWPTRDGSAIRDYIHVWDLARAHVLALQMYDDVLPDEHGWEVLNLGTGSGTTVRELVAAFQAVVGGEASVNESGPRPGDVIGCYTKSDKAQRLLGWRAEMTIEAGIRTSLSWSAERGQILATSADV